VTLKHFTTPLLAQVPCHQLGPHHSRVAQIIVGWVFNLLEQRLELRVVAIQPDSVQNSCSVDWDLLLTLTPIIFWFSVEE
jgi:hypothetical protein